MCKLMFTYSSFNSLPVLKLNLTPLKYLNSWDIPARPFQLHNNTSPHNREHIPYTEIFALAAHKVSSLSYVMKKVATARRIAEIIEEFRTTTGGDAEQSSRK